jgi:hypothetical protein
MRRIWRNFYLAIESVFLFLVNALSVPSDILSGYFAYMPALPQYGGILFMYLA